MKQLADAPGLLRQTIPADRLPLGAATAAEEAKVHCTGVNACKGQSACKTAKSECRGHNACKGQGFVEMTQKECDAVKAKQKARLDERAE